MLVEVKKIGKEERVTVTSLDVAETFGKAHKEVMRDIRELGCSDEFGVRNFAPSSYINSQNKKQPMYIMTRDGFTLLAMGYTGEKAMKFKEAYIKQFNVMEKQLNEKYAERQKGIAIRQALTSVIDRMDENTRQHGHAYSNYTNLIYKLIFGKSASKLREQYGIKKTDNLRDYFTKDELQEVQDKEMLVNGLLASGLGYEQIKEFLVNGLNNNRLIA